MKQEEPFFSTLALEVRPLSSRVGNLLPTRPRKVAGYISPDAYFFYLLYRFQWPRGIDQAQKKNFCGKRSLTADRNVQK